MTVHGTARTSLEQAVKRAIGKARFRKRTIYLYLQAKRTVIHNPEAYAKAVEFNKANRLEPTASPRSARIKYPPRQGRISKKKVSLPKINFGQEDNQ